MSDSEAPAGVRDYPVPMFRFVPSYLRTPRQPGSQADRMMYGEMNAGLHFASPSSHLFHPLDIESACEALLTTAWDSESGLYDLALSLILCSATGGAVVCRRDQFLSPKYFSLHDAPQSVAQQLANRNGMPAIRNNRAWG